MMPSYLKLSRREREIMDIIYRRSRVTAWEILEDVPAPPSYSALRTSLMILVRKGHAEYVREGRRYVYTAVRPRRQVSQAALKNLVLVFFEGSAEKTLAALLDARGPALSDAILCRMAELIEERRKRGC